VNYSFLTRFVKSFYLDQLKANIINFDLRCRRGMIIFDSIRLDLIDFFYNLFFSVFFSNFLSLINFLIFFFTSNFLIILSIFRQRVREISNIDGGGRVSYGLFIDSWCSGFLVFLNNAEFIKDIMPVFCMNYSVIARIIFLQKNFWKLGLNSRRIPSTKTNNQIHTFKTFNGTLCILSASKFINGSSLCKSNSSSPHNFFCKEQIN
jgi:hypothetical protein